MSRRRERSESGSTTVVAAGVMVVVLVMSLAAADVAHVLTAVSRAQTAADAAALAAAQELAMPSDRAPADAARAFAERNGAELVSCACDPGASEATVEVRAAVGALLFFDENRTVTARARAVVDRTG